MNLGYVIVIDGKVDSFCQKISIFKNKKDAQYFIRQLKKINVIDKKSIVEFKMVSIT